MIVYLRQTVIMITSKFTLVGCVGVIFIFILHLLRSKDGVLNLGVDFPRGDDR